MLFELCCILEIFLPTLTVFFLLWQCASVGVVLLELSSHHSNHYRNCWRNGEPSKSNKYALNFLFLREDHKKHILRRYFTCLFGEASVRIQVRILLEYKYRVKQIHCFAYFKKSYKQKLGKLVIELKFNLQYKLQLKLKFSSQAFHLPSAQSNSGVLSLSITYLSILLLLAAGTTTEPSMPMCYAISSAFLILLPNKC